MTGLPQMKGDDRFLKLTEVEQLTGYRKTTIYSMISKGEFPARHQIGPNRVVWLDSEVRDWMASRLATAA